MPYSSRTCFLQDAEHITYHSAVARFRSAVSNDEQGKAALIIHGSLILIQNKQCEKADFKFPMQMITDRKLDGHYMETFKKENSAPCLQKNSSLRFTPQFLRQCSMLYIYLIMAWTPASQAFAQALAAESFLT